MTRYYTDLKRVNGRWVPIWKYRRWAGWDKLSELNLVCEVCEELITGYGNRFCSQACYQQSFHLPERAQLVAVLKHKIEAGEYEVDPVEVADAMLYWGGKTDPIRSRRWTRHRLEELSG